MSLESRVREWMNRCTGCGKCTKVCPSLRHGGCNPKEIMQTGEGDLLNCIGCVACSKVCKFTDPYHAIRGLTALKYGLRPPEIFERTGYPMPLADGPATEEIPPQWNGDDVKIMPGCVVKCNAPFLEYAACEAVKAVGESCSELEGAKCCLRPPPFSVLEPEEKTEFKEQYMSNAGDSEVLALCGGCADELSDIMGGSTNMVTFFHDRLDRLPELKKKILVAIEPGCSLSNQLNDMVDILERIGCEYIGNGYGCCGKLLPVSEPLMNEREEECKGADLIVVACPKCLTKYDAFKKGIPAAYLPELIALAAGHGESFRYHMLGTEHLF